MHIALPDLNLRISGQSNDIVCHDQANCCGIEENGAWARAEGKPHTDGTGQLLSDFLEASNVDLIGDSLRLYCCHC